jgi:hypothetical protein
MRNAISTPDWRLIHVLSFKYGSLDLIGDFLFLFHVIALFLIKKGLQFFQFTYSKSECGDHVNLHSVVL